MDNRIITECDSEGNIIRENRYDADGNLMYSHISDWQNGRIVRKSSYDGEGNLTASFDYAYDERGNNTEGTWFLSKNGILMKAEFIYDENDRVIEKTHFGSGSLATNKTYNSYDEEGRLVTVKYYGSWPDGEVTYTSREYDDNGFLVKSTTSDGNGNLLNYELYTPNQFGKIDEYTHYDEHDNPVYRIRYHYDEEGNRIMTERYDGEGKLVSQQR